MTAVISAELFKLRTIRGPLAVALVVVALAGAAVAANASLLGDPGQPAATPAGLAQLAAAPGRLTGAAALLLGLLLATAEYRHSTVLTTRLGHPRVPSLLAGRTAAAVVAAVALAVLVEAVMLAGGAAVLASRDVAVEPLRHGTPGAVTAMVVVTALHAVVGVAVGELLRSPALAVGVVFGWAFLVEGVLPVVLRSPQLDRWLPTGAVRSALSLGQPLPDGLLAPSVGLALLAGYAVALWLAGLARGQVTDP